jgi:hypothetical protein
MANLTTRGGRILIFFFFSIYALLLIALATCILILPLDKFIILVKVFCAVTLVAWAISIMLQWPRKQRMVRVLLYRNRDGYNAESFRPYMDELCTQLVVIYVLHILGEEKHFRELFREFLRGQRNP